MAIAPLPEQMELDLLEIPWPTPTLRVVGTIVTEPDLELASICDLRPQTGPDLSERRQIRMQRRLRRRRLSVALFVAIATIALSLPLTSLGTVTVSGQATPGGLPAGLVDGSLYVVQPGDSLASIASRINPGADQARLISQMRHSIGSSTLVPGEHIQLP